MKKYQIVDVDVHHSWPSDRVLLDYVDGEFKEYFSSMIVAKTRDGRPSRGEGSGQNQSPGESGGWSPFDPPNVHFPDVSGGNLTWHGEPPADGSIMGSSYELLRQRILDPYKIDRAVLTFGYGMNAGISHAAASVAMCRAMNDYTVDQWLDGRDERLYGVLLMPLQVPTEAVKEIKRLGSHPKIVGILMGSNPFGKGLGHPVYHPIYEVAAEMGLAVVTHLDGGTGKGYHFAGGVPTTMPEYYTLMVQPGMHHVSSLLVEGVFEKFPDLHFLMNENGFAWVPWVVWALDSRYKLLKMENPNLRRLPSEYFRDHIWLGTQPFDMEVENDRLIRLIELFGGLEEQLCWCSDYPHWNTEDPPTIAGRLPQPWRRKVLGLNAYRLFRWHIGDGGFEEPAERAEVAL